MKARLKKSARRPPIGDKHKTSRREGCSLAFLTDWLVTSSRWRLLEKATAFSSCDADAAEASLVELDNSQSRKFYTFLFH